MSVTRPQESHLPHDVPDEPEPGSLPVEPDQGPIPAEIPEDPERERTVNPAD